MKGDRAADLAQVGGSCVDQRDQVSTGHNAEVGTFMAPHGHGGS